MDIDELLGIDHEDPAARHAALLVNEDAKFVAELVAFRESQNLTQADVATRMGIDPSGVSKIESGHRDLLQSTIQRYAMAVGAVVAHEVRSFREADRERTSEGIRNTPAQRFRSTYMPNLVESVKSSENVVPLYPADKSRSARTYERRLVLTGPRRA